LDDRLPPDVEVERLGVTGFCCLLPDTHPLAAAPEIGFAELERETIISYRSATRPHDELDHAARRAGARFTPLLEIDVSISAVGFVQSGLGIAVVDALLPWSQFSGVVQRPLRADAVLPLSLLTARGKILSRAEEAMRQEIRKISAAYL
ncbi:LysR family transcriptional regulator, partial [Thioclava sp. BHET1]